MPNLTRAIPIFLVAALAGACGDTEPGEGAPADTASDTAAAAGGGAGGGSADEPGTASGRAPERPDYARLRAEVCDTLLNSFDCARAVEAEQLPEEGVSRHGDTLRLALSGDTARFVDQPGDHAEVAYYSYQDRWPEDGFYLVQKQYYEGAEYLLVDDSTGALTRMPDWPRRAPGGRYFAVLSLDLVAGYGPNTLQVWALEEGKPTRVWETEPSQWGPTDGRWTDSTTLEFTQHGYCGELGGEGRSMCDRPARLRLEGGAWHLDRGELPSEGRGPARDAG